jgi:hypothetical protein
MDSSSGKKTSPPCVSTFFPCIAAFSFMVVLEYLPGPLPSADSSFLFHFV